MIQAFFLRRVGTQTRKLTILVAIPVFVKDKVSNSYQENNGFSFSFIKRYSFWYRLFFSFLSFFLFFLCFCLGGGEGVILVSAY